MSAAPLGWPGIVRLGLIQASLGAVIVLTTSTLNRVMVVELMLAASVPGMLVAIHHATQMLRPRFGHGSDVGGRRTPWIIGGMAVLAVGGCLAALATVWMATAPWLGFALAALAFVLIGGGAAASGTSLLALTAVRVAPERRPAAAATIWLMMIAGFVVTTITAGALLDPFSPARLVAVTAGVALAAFMLSVAAVWGVEGAASPSVAPSSRSTSFVAAMREIWAEAEARRFTLFVFVAMLAYGTQDLILEPFAGLVFGFTPGESTQLAGIQYMGVFLGMIGVVLAGNRGLAPKGWMRRWTIVGCIASGVALLGLVIGGWVGAGWPLRVNVFVLGVTTGAFAVAAIGSMMTLADSGAAGREGVRLGLWGAAQAIASALGAFLGTVAVDAARAVMGTPVAAYTSVFAVEAALFFLAAYLAVRVVNPLAATPYSRATGGGAVAPTTGG